MTPDRTSRGIPASRRLAWAACLLSAWPAAAAAQVIPTAPSPAPPAITGQYPNAGIDPARHAIIRPGTTPAVVPPGAPRPFVPINGKYPRLGEPHYGFGLGYHPGIGYGGFGLGVNPDGGYPFYGGPGYPCNVPALQRWNICGYNPFPYNPGLGYPTPEHPNYFGGVGPLVGDQPVIVFEPDPLNQGFVADYGCYTGGAPDAERRFAPFTLEAAVRGSTSGVITPVPPTSAPGSPSSGPASTPGSMPALPPANTPSSMPPAGAIGNP